MSVCMCKASFLLKKRALFAARNLGQRSRINADLLCGIFCVEHGDVEHDGWFLVMLKSSYKDMRELLKGR